MANKPPSQPITTSAAMPFVVNTILDGVTITGSNKQLGQYMKDFIETGIDERRFKPISYKFRYFHAARIPIRQGANGGLELYCKTNGQWMACWNPGFMSINDDVVVRKILRQFLKDGFSDIWKKGGLSGHLAIDIAHITPDMVVSKRQRSRKSNVWVNSQGQIETIYFGSDPVKTVLYNKGIELDEKKIHKLRANGAYETDMLTPLHFDLMRFEERDFQLEPKLSVEKVINPLHDMKIYWFHKLALSGVIPELLLDSCRLRGIHGALQLLPECNRKHLWKEFQHHKNVLSALDGADALIARACRRLYMLAPTSEWKSYRDNIPCKLRNYVHCGYVNRHFLKEAFDKEPSIKQRAVLQKIGLDYKVGERWEYNLLGKPLRLQDAYRLIKLRDSKKVVTDAKRN